MLEDKFTRGFLAGLAGGIVANIISFVGGALGTTDVRTADLIGIFFFAKEPPFTSGEVLYGLIGHLIITGAIGIVFAYLIPHIKRKYIAFKGIMGAMIIWYFAYIITTLFRLPGTVPTDMSTALTDGVTTIAYGLVLGVAYGKLSRGHMED